MPSPLLLANGNHLHDRSTSCSSTDDDEAYLERKEAQQKRTKLNKCKYILCNRHRHNLHRSIRRNGRLLLCCLLVPAFFLILYLPLFSSNHSRQVPLTDWDYNTSRNIADYVLPDNDTTLIEPRNICQKRVFLLIVVCSSMRNFEIRQMIRETWGNTTEFNYGMYQRLHAHLNGTYLNPTQERINYYKDYLQAVDHTTNTGLKPVVRVVFLIGRSKDKSSVMSHETLLRIRNESTQYDDIIQENFIDTYKNLTLKSVMALKWLARRCMQNVAFFMKCDDDTFVHVPNLLHFLLGGTIPLYNDTLSSYDISTYKTLAESSRLHSTRNYLVGYLFCSSRPVANVSSKWYVPYYMYPKDRYPNYLSGAGYVMSADVVPRLYQAALNISLIYLEDVYVTGMCAAKYHIRPRHHPLFNCGRSMEWCAFKGSITQHELKDGSLMDAYAFVANVSIRCPPPPRHFKRPRMTSNACS